MKIIAKTTKVIESLSRFFRRQLLHFLFDRGIPLSKISYCKDTGFFNSSAKFVLKNTQRLLIALTTLIIV